MKIKTLGALAILLSNLLFIFSASADPEVCYTELQKSSAYKFLSTDWYSLLGENSMLPTENIKVLSSDHKNGTCVFKFYNFANAFMVAKADVKNLYYCEGYYNGSPGFFLKLSPCLKKYINQKFSE